MAGEARMFKVALKAIDALGAEVLPEQLNSIARTHSILAVGAAIIPVPGASEIAGAVNIWYMYKKINNALGIKFSDNKLKTIVGGVVANLGTYALISVGASALLKFIPGLGTVGGTAIDMALLPAITYTSAFIYLQAICSMAEKAKEGYENMSADNLKEEIDDYMKDNKSEITDVMKDAKKEFKDAKKQYTKEDAKKFAEMTKDK